MLPDIKNAFMNESTDHKVRYIPEDGIFIMNMSGRMDERELARRAEEIKKCLERNLKNNEAIKVLADYRNVQWDAEATHYKAREIINGRLAEFRDHKHFSAILNDPTLWGTLWGQVLKYQFRGNRNRQ